MTHFFIRKHQIHYRYRVTIQVVSNLPLKSKQMFCFSMRPMY